MSRVGKLAALALIAAILVACQAASVYPSAPPPVVAQATLKPTPSPTSTPAPTATARPTPTPAVVDFGLKYTTAACYETDWQDAQGHSTPGVAVTFDVKVDNPGKRKGTLWFGIDQTDWFTTSPSRIEQSWTKPKGLADERRILIGSPTLKAGTSTVTFKLLFATPFEPHYDLYAGVTEPGKALAVGLDDMSTSASTVWAKLWTSSSIC